MNLHCIEQVGIDQAITAFYDPIRAFKVARNAHFFECVMDFKKVLVNALDRAIKAMGKSQSALPDLMNRLVVGINGPKRRK